MNCANLKSIIFEGASSLTTLETDAFVGCTAVESIKLPSSLETIPSNALSLFENLKRIEFAENSKITTISSSTFAGCSNLKSVIFGNNSELISVGDETFKSFIHLEEVRFGQNSKLTSIGFAAFYSCTSLQRIEIPKTVKTIGSYSFWGCQNAEIIFDSNSELSGMIGYEAFRNCYKLTKIIIPKTVTSIPSKTFLNCSSVTEIVLAAESGYKWVIYEGETTNVLVSDASTLSQEQLISYFIQDTTFQQERIS